MDNTIIIILRIIHIMGGIFWVGSGLFMARIVLPTLKEVGKDGYPYIAGVEKYSPMQMAFPIAAVSTTLAGLILYYSTSGHFNADWMKSTSGMVLSIGALAGLLAAGHGAGLGKISGEFGKTVENIVNQGKPVTSEQEAQVKALLEKLIRNTNVSLGLMMIAVLGMVSFRYIG